MEATFCFVDMAGFSALTETHGDDAAARLALRLGDLVNAALPRDGRLVKSIGDAAFAMTATPSEGIEFVRRLWSAAGREPDFPILRAGLHHGDAVERAGDVFGAAVNLAARVAGQARGGQLLATARIAEAARARGISIAPLGRVPLRNVREPVEIFALEFEDETSGIIDPVCRMRVDAERAGGHVRVQGAVYWFCSLDCLRTFAADPAAYAHPAR